MKKQTLAAAADQGFEIVAGSPAEFERTIQADYERYGTIVRKAGIRLE